MGKAENAQAALDALDRQARDEALAKRGFVRDAAGRFAETAGAGTSGGTFPGMTSGRVKPPMGSKPKRKKLKPKPRVVDRGQVGMPLPPTPFAG